MLLIPHREFQNDADGVETGLGGKRLIPTPVDVADMADYILTLPTVDKKILCGCADF